MCTSASKDAPGQKEGFIPETQPCLGRNSAQLLQRTGNLSPPFRTVRSIRLAEYHRAELFMLELSWATRASGHLAEIEIVLVIMLCPLLRARWDPTASSFPSSLLGFPKFRKFGLKTLIVFSPPFPLAKRYPLLHQIHFQTGISCPLCCQSHRQHYEMCSPRPTWLPR